MTNENQVEDTSRPEEAEFTPTQRVTEVLAHVPPLEDEVVGTMHVSSNTDVPSPPKTETAQGVAPAFQDNTVPENDWDWSQLARPPFILSFVDNDDPNGGFVIGWDTCGACMLHIRTCSCKNGPQQPNYVKRWRSKADTHHDKPATATERKKAIVAANAADVEAAVEQTLATDETTPSGRKRRADAGKPRGPRKKGTAESVLEAAGDLSAAMNKGT